MVADCWPRFNHSLALSIKVFTYRLSNFHGRKNESQNTASTYFTEATFHFLTELSRHNEHDWFNDNKQRYEDCVRSPALAFIEDIAPELQLIAPRFLAVPKKVGGMSLGEDFMDEALTHFSGATPYLRLLCAPLNLRFD